MSDSDQISGLIKLASDPGQLQNAQQIVAQRLLNFDGEVYPQDGCAITLSVLMQDAGIPVPDTFQALAMGDVLKNRGWKTVQLGQQQAGDVGSTVVPNPIMDAIISIWSCKR
jgi:hypothetical protein